MIRQVITETAHENFNLARLTYAVNLKLLVAVVDERRYRFVHGDICEQLMVKSLLTYFRSERRQSPGGRIARRPFDQWIGLIYRYQHCRDFRAVGSGTQVVDAAFGFVHAAVLLSAYSDRRGTRKSCLG